MTEFAETKRQLQQACKQLQEDLAKLTRLLNEFDSTTKSNSPSGVIPHKTDSVRKIDTTLGSGGGE